MRGVHSPRYWCIIHTLHILCKLHKRRVVYMSHTISIINQKGGVGKTTTAQALGAELTCEGKMVLLVELDTKGNLSKAVGAATRGKTALEVLKSEAKAQEAIQTTPEAHIIAAGPGLGADGILTRTGKEYRL